MSFYDLMISKLTDVFNKAKEGNVGKLFSIIAKQLDDLEFTLRRMDEWRDIDNAKGVHLDRLGSEIVQEFRNGQSDEEYRLRIKTKIIANLSKGDIETINNVLQMFLGDSFIGVREMWSIDDPLIEPEPAGILITTKIHVPFPAGVIGRVTAGGISVYWRIIFEPRNFAIKREIGQGKSEFVYAGELYCGPVYDHNTSGVSIPSDVDLAAVYLKGVYVFPDIPNYAGEITDSTSGFLTGIAVDVEKVNNAGLLEFQYSGDEWSEGVSIEKEMDIDKQDVAGAVSYPFTGETHSGER